MADSTPISFQRMMTAVTQEPGDPTFSVLKAHLIFEELLRTYLYRELPNPKALESARLTFAQLLAVARACSPVSDVSWHWEAIAKLNSLRNMLSHSLAPAERDSRIADFVSFVTSNGTPMPPPTIVPGGPVPPGQFFLEIDMATGGLFGFTVGELGFELDFDRAEGLPKGVV